MSTMDWSPEVEELRTRTRLAEGMGGAERVATHRAQGKLTVRERIGRLLDPGSFAETGVLAGQASYNAAGNLTAFQPSNFVTGLGTIDGRKVVVAGDDFTIRGGSAEARAGDKMGYSEQMAVELGVPMVRLVDGQGGSVTTIEKTGRTYVPGRPNYLILVEAMSVIPVASAALGSVAGLGAARVAASHFSVMTEKTAQVFVAGPPVVKRALGSDVSKEELGPASVQCAAGAVDNAAVDEEDALQQVRRFLSYMPDNVWQLPPAITCEDPVDRRDEDLLRLIPRNRRRAYAMRTIIACVVDHGSFFEMGRGFGRSLITGLARLNGFAVGVMANDPTYLAGAITADAAKKMTRFIDLCDTFHLPVVNLVDNPGYMVGPDAERVGTIREGVRSLFAVYQASVPWVSVIVRKAYGVAGGAHQNSRRFNMRYAWPSGEWGSLPIEGGVDAAYRREIEAAPDPAARRREIEERIERLRSPFRTAEAFDIENIIDPRDTRRLLCEWAAMAHKSSARTLGPTKRGMRP
jgi:acetyl-CoA carboxylase carboxyltransferase component